MDLDRTIHEPARLRLMMILSGVEMADFAFLLAAIGLTKGNLSSHMSRLEQAGYVEIGKSFNGKVPHTEYRLTRDGRAALSDYWKSLDEMQQPVPDDEKWMRRALELAARGKGRVEPNPPVGAVIVKNGKVIGEGFHDRFGGPHAEIHAMVAARGRGCRDATLYVTLEPCTGSGPEKKTPPCCDAIVKAGFRRAVIGARDPTGAPAVPQLEATGISVTCGVLEPECHRLIAPFLKLHTQKKPYVIAKWAMTADGKIATVTGDAKWISSESSRALVHQWRNEVDAVLVGIGTVRRDDPLLTCRLPEGRSPLRVILDANASLPPESRLVRSAKEAPLLVACLDSAPEESCRRLADAGCRVLRFGGEPKRVDVEELLCRLGEEKLTNLMVEGGAEVLGYLFDHRLVDEVRIFISPKLISGAAAPGPLAGAGIRAMSDALMLESVEWQNVGPDMLITSELSDLSDASDGSDDKQKGAHSCKTEIG